MYSYEDVITYIEEEDVKFVKLAFCDINGVQKNISLLAEEFKNAFRDGVSFDASAIKGFGSVNKSDLFLFPDCSTLAVLPWRPAHGRVIRLYCDIKYPDGTFYNKDTRYILKQAIKKANDRGIKCFFGSELEFYLFKTDENGEPTNVPFDRAGYLDIAPDDKGENVRREICFSLEEMGIHPETSHHEEGPGQNEIDFKYSDSLAAADNALTFKNVVKTISQRNGLYADFSAKPIEDESGNGFHVNISVKSNDSKDYSESFMAGILKHIKEITYFMNPTEQSYKRFGALKAPKYVTWSKQNRSQLIRIPAAEGNHRRIELRSPDPMSNPYIVYAMLIYAGLDGIENNLSSPEPCDIDLYNAPKKITDKLELLPQSLEEAIILAKNSAFVNSVLPEGFIEF